MSTQLFQTAAISDDATFRLRGKQMSDAFVAAGMVRRTAGEDSGQIDWATVARPLANTTAGYEVFRFADTLQTTAPVLFKISWGCGGATDRLRLLLEVGVATDGAGTLVGVKTASRTLSLTSAQASWMCRVSGSTNRLLFVWNYTADSASYGLILSIERTHNAGGGDTAEGVFVIVLSPADASSTTSVFLSFASGVVSIEVGLSVLLPSVGGGSTGTQTMVFPIFPVAGPFMNPSLNLAVMFSGNCTSGVPITFTLLGASRIFFPVYTATVASWRPAVRGTVAEPLCWLARGE